MRLLTLCFAFLASVQARFIEQSCDGIVVRNILHEKEVLKDGLDSPYQLSMDYDSNILYFSYSVSGYENTFKSGYLNLKTNYSGEIYDVPGGFASTVDRKNHVVYLGGNDGIYTYDYCSKKSKFFGDRGTNIWQMFFKDKLYYTSYPNEKAYTFEKGMPIPVPELWSIKVMLIAVDNNDNIVFSNATGLFRYVKDQGEVFSLGGYSVNGLTSDLSGNIYFSTGDGIHSIGNNGEVQTLATLENVFGMAIEGDNTIIFSDDKGISRLKPTRKVCFVNDKKTILAY